MATTSLPEKSHAETLLQDSALSKLPAAFSIVMVDQATGHEREGTTQSRNLRASKVTRANFA